MHAKHRRERSLTKAFVNTNSINSYTPPSIRLLRKAYSPEYKRSLPKSRLTVPEYGAVSSASTGSPPPLLRKAFSPELKKWLPISRFDRFGILRRDPSVNWRPLSVRPSVNGRN